MDFLYSTQGFFWILGFFDVFLEGFAEIGICCARMQAQHGTMMPISHHSCKIQYLPLELIACSFGEHV